MFYVFGESSTIHSNFLEYIGTERRNRKNKTTNISIGSWLQSGSSVIAEIMARAGFDWIAADIEHSSMGWESFSAFVRAAKMYGAKPFARVEENSTMAIRRALDCGAEGVIVPLISSAAEARQAVAAAKYPPTGIRGFAFCQANAWGEDFDDYAANANGQIPVIVMVESKEAVDNIEDILAVEGVDGVFIGPYDLSGSYGLIGQTGHPVVSAAKQRIVKACLKQKKMAGQHIVLPTESMVQEAIAQGYNLLALGMDTVFVADHSKRLLSNLRCGSEPATV